MSVGRGRPATKAALDSSAAAAAAAAASGAEEMDGARSPLPTEGQSSSGAASAADT